MAFGVPVFWGEHKPDCYEVIQEGETESHIVDHVRELAQLGCYEPVRSQYPRCVLPAFSRFSSNKLRTIIDSRGPNHNVVDLKFTLLTNVNFCELLVDGAVLITSDFSKCWHQLRMLPQDTLYYCIRIVKDGFVRYFRPTAKTFGQNHVPFAITKLVAVITNLINKFALCAFWIDDGIIRAGNTNDRNWRETVNKVRFFVAWLFTVLCFCTNEKSDFQAWFEKEWVGTFNGANGTFPTARKVIKLCSLLSEITERNKISLSQCQSIYGKFVAYMGTNRRNPFFKVITSYLKNTISLLETRMEADPFLFLSEKWDSWVRLSTRLLLDTFVLRRKKPIKGCKPFFIVVDASNVGGGVVILDPSDPSFHTQAPTPLFQCADLLPRSHRAFVFNSKVEASSTDCERITLLLLGIRVARTFLESRYPNTPKFLNIRTDSSALEAQVNLANSNTTKVILDVHKIWEELADWNHPWSLEHHKRDEPLAKLADELTRAYYPSLNPSGFRVIRSWLPPVRFRIRKVPLPDLLCRFSIDLPDGDILMIPLQLPDAVYIQIIAILRALRPYAILMPKLKVAIGALSPVYKQVFELDFRCFFKPHPSFKVHNKRYSLFLGPDPTIDDVTPSSGVRSRHGEDVRLRSGTKVLSPDDPSGAQLGGDNGLQDEAGTDLEQGKTPV